MEIAEKNFFELEVCKYVSDFIQKMFSEFLAICGGSFDKLQELIDDPELSKKTVFDLDLSNPNDPLYKYQMFLAIHSLTEGPMTAGMERIKNMAVLKLLKNDREKNIAKALLLRIFRVFRFNFRNLEWLAKSEDVHGLSVMKVGLGLLPFGSLINHSCFPNVDRMAVDNKFVFYVQRPILKGQKLTVTFG